MRLIPGQSFSDNIVNNERLHNLVDLASTLDIGPSDLASGADFVRSVQPAAVDGANYLSSVNGSIHFYDGIGWVPTATFAETLLMTNAGSTTIEASWPVVMDGATNNGIVLSSSSSANHRVVGVAAEQITASATKAVYTRGIVPCSVRQDLVITPAGSFLKGPAVSFNTGAILEDDPTAGAGLNFQGAYFGMLVEDVAAGSAVVTAMAWIWR